MAPPVESPLYRSRSLPTEAELRELIESMVIHDPYSLPDLPTIEIVLATAQAEYNEDYAEYQEQLKAWNEDPNKDLDEQPEEPARKVPDLQRICPAYSFRDDSVRRDVVPRNDDTHRIAGGYSYYSEREKEGLLTAQTNPDFQELTNQWPEDFRERLNRSCHASAILEATKIQRASELAYHVRGRYDSFIENCMALQRALLVTELRKAGHIRKLGEIELRAEIRLRKKQYPGQQILVMVGNKLQEYYMALFNGSHLLEGALLTEAPRKSSYHGQPRDFEGYESAVVALSQIRSSHSFEHHYSINRVDRGWNMVIGMLMNFGIQITPRAEERAQADSRQQMLFVSLS